jgi:hypothetical protein
VAIKCLSVRANSPENARHEQEEAILHFLISAPEATCGCGAG